MQKKTLNVVFSAGIVLVAGVCMGLIFLSLSPGRSLFSVSGVSDRDVFHRLLRSYDTFIAASPGISGEAFGAAVQMLDKLEQNALGVESHLSVLKRRRNLARQSPRFLGQYRDAALRAAAAFPYSEPLAAVAAGALLQNSPAAGGPAERLPPELAGPLRNYVSLIAETRLSPLALGVHALLGDLESPGSAAAARMEPFLTAGLPLLRGSLPADEENRLIADLGILQLLQQDIPGAAVQVQTISAGTAEVALLHFIAEYYYDFGDPLRGAEIFSRFSDEASMIRSADSLWLGKQAASARNIWKMLAASQGDPNDAPSSASGGESQPEAPAASSPPEIRIRSLYNLAATAEDQKEEAAWLERLFAEGRNKPSLQSDPCFLFGVIRYTRLLDTSRALAILGEGELQTEPLLDLELLRRRGELWPVDRTVAETWLLLGRHPGEAALYQWGAYYFDHQRKYGESAMLIKNAALHQIGGPWLDLNGAIQCMEAGRIDEGEALLRAIPRSAGIWQVHANLGRIMEARHAPGAALEFYETAASLVKEREGASRVQLRIAGCLQALGRIEDSRRVLEYALDLNPDNLKARMELRRINNE
ncbi:hypothetical protein AGMMS49546_27880 [Spirochaetia bacterium]|nr:hypothetical protein AGMMS49546_27880 [Spirochaetia bacterium]